jgi:hypothetical protein
MTQQYTYFITALQDLLAKVEAGVRYETMGHTQMCQRAFPKPDNFDGSREAYANSAAQQAILVWRNGSLDAAAALHEAVLPMWVGMIKVGADGNPSQCVVSLLYPRGANSTNISVWNSCPARAWLIAIIKALIAKETT